MPNDAEGIATAIADRVVRNDTDRAIMDGAGYFASWMDDTRRFGQAAVDLFCGSVSQGNGIHIVVPPEVGEQGRTVAAVQAVVAAMITGFGPVWAGVFDRGIPTMWSGPDGIRLPVVGWMLFLPSPLPLVSVSSTRIERCAGTTNIKQCP